MRRSALSRALALALLAMAPSVAQADEPRHGIRVATFSSATTPLAVLLADADARAVVARHAPKLLELPNLPRASGMTLADVQPFAADMLTPAVIGAIDADLAKLPPSAGAKRLAAEAIADIDAAALDPADPWITHPAAFATDFEGKPVALQFRRTLRLQARPPQLRVRVSADNRFILYVNGTRVAAGPARGDLAHWRYEAIDLAPYLQAGDNVIAAQVWNDGKVAPVAEISTGHTGFMLRAEAVADRAIDTGPSWRVRLDRSRSVSSGRQQMTQQIGPTYYAAGAPERLDGAQLRGDGSAGDPADDWQAPAVAVTRGERRRTQVADALPPMRFDRVDSGKVVRATGVRAEGFPLRPVTIPAHSEATLLIDAGRVLAAYPALTTSGGKGAEVSLAYAEALYDPVAMTPGPRQNPVRFPDRARVADGRVLGVTDTILPDGRAKQGFAPFWWRAWRFVEIRVKTGDAPLTLDSFETRETGYPFQQRGRFVSSDPQLNRIWSIGWMTGLFDAHETYMDSAYWEQLQYIGDTRIQAMLSYDVGGDPRLAVQALDAFDASRVVDGLPQSSWPISSANPIPPFALLWVGMLHDYWMREPDSATLRRNLPGLRTVLDWYQHYARADGMVGGHPGWLFVDWRDGLDGGRDRTGTAPDSCVISLLRVGALQEAADLERAVGDPARATADIAEAARARAGIQARCWDAKRGLYADTPQKTGFSQHANALAILYDVAPKDAWEAILSRITVPGHGIDAPAGVIGTTFYFSFYLARALDHAGLGDRYIDLLETWRGLLKQNFTTWPENPDPSRSDTHAWSAHPTSGLLTYVAGIQPDAPGFARVRITPHLGTLTSLDAAMAHPAGLVTTRYSRAGGRLHAEIGLPTGIAGTFAYGGRDWPLKPGPNVIDTGVATDG